MRDFSGLKLFDIAANLSVAATGNTRYKRWGLIKEHPDYLAVAKQVNKIDIYKQAATLAKASLPKSELRTSKFMDGVVWDGKDPKKYADSFKIHA